MKPLLFLTTRSIYNGIRRALTTPRRLITIVIFIGYYYYFFMRPGLIQSRLMPRNLQLPAPPLDVLEAAVFGLFVMLSMLLMMTIFTQMGGFKPADVDILFPTPVSPRIILGFRIFRDYITTLLMPVLFGLFAFVPLSQAWLVLIRKMPYPDAGPLTIKAVVVAWILMALVWVTITYALNLFINRSDLQSDKNKKVISWSIGIAIGIVVLYLVYAISSLQSPREAVDLAQSPILRAFFFTAAFATQMVMAPLTGNWLPGLIGAGSMIAIITLAVHLAMSQHQWMYDQAAVKGFGSSERRALQQKGDFYGMVASMAREGKLKAGKRSWLHKLRLQGPVALLWKDLFLQTRGMKFLMLMLLAISLFMNLLPAFMVGSGRRASDIAAGFTLLGMQSVTLLMMTLSYAQTGFMELLRRVDTQKPLPFSPATTVFMELVSKSALGTVGAWVSALIMLVIKPGLWAFVLTAIVVGPFVSILISSASLLLTLMFPDIDDPSQRTLRGLLMMLAIVVFAIPGLTLAIGGFAGLAAINVAPQTAVLILAVPVAAVNLGVSILVAWLSGNLYANYNPTE